LLFFYSFLIKRSPIVVIRVPERQIGKPYAQITSAVRCLADDFGLRVIVDGSRNSLPPELLTTKRQMVIDVEPMSKEQIESIPELKVLICFLKIYNFDEAVWKVLGGSPTDYLKLKEYVHGNLLLYDAKCNKVVVELKNRIHSVLSDSLNKYILNSSKNTDKIIEIFKEKKIIKIPKSELRAMGFSLDYSNKVFHEVKPEGRWFVEPSTPAISLIISENVHDDNGVFELSEKLFRIAP